MPADRFLHPKAGHSDKVTRLTDFEYRVWTQYLLSADDFGVMRATAVNLQADNDALAQVKPAVVAAAVERLINCGLVRVFEHQGRRYVYQHDWQTWQKVEFPRTTNEPKPPADAIGLCDAVTQALFAKHPGGQRKLRGGKSDVGGGGVQASTPVHAPVHIPNGSGYVQDARAVHVPTTRARARPKRLTANANGSRLTAEFGEGVETPLPPFDVWLRELQAVYPQTSVTSGHLTETAFLDVFDGDPRQPDVVFGELLEHLENQKRGYQWRVKRMVPNLERWLREGLWKQLHEEQPPTALVSERTLQTDIAGDAFVKGGPHGTH